MTTLDVDISRCFEPNAASPQVRIMQLERLIASGIASTALLDPILPGLTDDETALEDLLSEVARCGVRHAAASTLFLRPKLAEALRRELRGTPYADRLLARFLATERIGIHAERSSVMALPHAVREAINARVRSVAARHGIAVHICACKNPDVASGSCHIAGRSDNEDGHRDQLDLF